MANPIEAALNKIANATPGMNISEGGGGGAMLSPGGSVVPVRRLRPDEDSMAGKTFVHIEGELKGRREVVEYTIEQNGRYSVIFKSGIQMLIDDLNIQMVEADQYFQSVKKTDGILFEDEVSLDDIRPSRVNRGVNNVEPQFEAYTPEKIEGLEYINKPNLQYPPAQPVQSNKQSPIIELLEKMKTGPAKVNLELELNIPSKEVYNMLVNTFSGAEDDIIEYLFTGKNFRDLKTKFIEAINKYYEVVKEVEVITEPTEPLSDDTI